MQETMGVIIAAIITAIAQIVAAIITTRHLNERKHRETSENTSSNTKGRSRVAWITSAIAVIGMAFFYLTAMTDACSNHDLLAMSIVFGAPMSILLITRKSGYRVLWIAPSLVSFAIGMPFGHNYGTMTKTALFGITQGSACQQFPDVLIVLGVLMVLAIIDYVVQKRANT